MALSELVNGYARSGAVMWIGVRPERRAPLLALTSVVVTETGIEGDHRVKAGKRAVSLIQWEHLPVIAALANKEAVAPEELRRNFVVSGINLLGLRNRTFRIGEAILRGTGICAPCSRMEENLGLGGYAAVRGHGGITADIVSPGRVSLADQVEPVI
ncbi:MOSC domain-containing protein [Parvibaculaceae bacterium PLY_AMNH_Bact1]|nr:MOSC domain-containing protein [Parvibaculaceae bacterium PLY_AMNH_Bact1]